MIFGWFVGGLGGFWLVWVVFGWFGWFLAGLGGFWLVSNFSSNAVVYDHSTLPSSERVVPTSSAPLLTNQHENADVSFIDLRSYLPEISGMQSSKLPPLLGGGDNYSLISP